MTSRRETSEERETGRLEAFSDGVFAFAITLLVLYLKDPTQGAGATGSLLQGLIAEWPEFFAFVTSFMTILVMWVGHHSMFDYIVRIDRRFMFLNGFLLFFVTLNPFTTSLAANHVLSSDSETAVGVYAGGFLALSISWNFMWRHASKDKRLLRKAMADEQIKMMARAYYVGPIVYAAAFVVALFSGIAGLVLMFAVGLFYAVGTRDAAQAT